MVLHLGEVLRSYAFEFIGIQETQQLLDSLERSHPTLVHEVIPKIVSLQTLTEVLRRLVEEGISIRNMRQILQSLAEWGSVERDPMVLTEYVRGALRRQISYMYTADSKSLRVLLLDPVIEQTVRESIQATDKGNYLAMEPDLSHDIIQAVHSKLDGQPTDEPYPVILTTMEIRRYVRRLLEVEFPSLPVLSFGEILPDIQVQPVARISVA
jgi:type III secretion protein V